MQTHTRRSTATIPKFQLLALSVLCMISAFAIGSQTSGNVHTIGSTEALDGRLPGDINGDNRIDYADVIIILEVANGYKKVTPKELMGDPNADGALTIDDALHILRDLNVTPLN